MFVCFGTLVSSILGHFCNSDIGFSKGHDIMLSHKIDLSNLSPAYVFRLMRIIFKEIELNIHCSTQITYVILSKYGKPTNILNRLFNKKVM